MRGIGVAVITSTSARSPSPQRPRRWSTPKRCCRRSPRAPDSRTRRRLEQGVPHHDRRAPAGDRGRQLSAPGALAAGEQGRSPAGCQGRASPDAGGRNPCYRRLAAGLHGGSASVSTISVLPLPTSPCNRRSTARPREVGADRASAPPGRRSVETDRQHRLAEAAIAGLRPPGLRGGRAAAAGPAPAGWPSNFVEGEPAARRRRGSERAASAGWCSCRSAAAKPGQPQACSQAGSCHSGTSGSSSSACAASCSLPGRSSPRSADRPPRAVRRGRTGGVAISSGWTICQCWP